MEFWEKIAKDIEGGAATISEKAGDWFKVSAEFVKDGAEVISDKAKIVTRFTKLKWEQRDIQNQIKTKLIELGDVVFSEWTNAETLLLNESMQTKIDDVRKLQAALEPLEREIEILSEELSHSSGKDLEKELEASGGTIKQVRVTPNSPVFEKQIKAIELPPEVLIGTIARDEKIIIPNGDTTLLANDKVTLLGKNEAIISALNLFEAGD